MKPYDERLEDIDKKIQQLKNTRVELEKRQKNTERKNRTRRLTTIGAEMEKAASEIIDPKVLAAYLQKTVKYDIDGSPIKVIDLQKKYYKETAERLMSKDQDKVMEKYNFPDDDINGSYSDVQL